MALSSDFYADCAVGAVAVRARRSYKNGGFHSDPIAADGFGVDSFTDTRAAPSWRISSIKQSHDLARHFEVPPSATGLVKIWGRPAISLIHQALGRSAELFAEVGDGMKG
jgi:hypothetical protein